MSARCVSAAEAHPSMKGCLLALTITSGGSAMLSNANPTSTGTSQARRRKQRACWFVRSKGKSQEQEARIEQMIRGGRLGTGEISRGRWSRPTSRTRIRLGERPGGDPVPHGALSDGRALGKRSTCEKPLPKTTASGMSGWRSRRRTGVHIGMCGLHRARPEDRGAELGIMIGDKSFWSNGYGTDTVQTLLRFAFEQMNLHKVALGVFEFNERAWRATGSVALSTKGAFARSTFRTAATGTSCA